MWINGGSWAREACGHSLSMYSTPTNAPLHGALASIHGVNTILISKLGPNPPITTASGRFLGGPIQTGQYCQLSKWTIWEGNSGFLCIQSVVERRHVPRVITPLVPYEESSLREGVQLEKCWRSRAGSLKHETQAACSTG